ncbi:hypothetical protein IB233_04580 [Comamonas sp. CMM01]|uniref:hypothetical protein n=1 Tax=Comamonas sp. CMM01 TaxID=2769280 RepID=UPI001786DA0D|nr:hypothetical protein [Comamonas sp. CMM01]MBD9530912.1 hypothetical protein [Comamonas sp. CMM01]
MSTKIQDLPTPPQPSDTPAEFNSHAFSLLGALPGFVAQTNALGAEVEQNATAAASAKTAAAASQTAAKTSETNSAASKTAAATSATAAASSQTVAKTSETNAKASETAAANSATAAASSQTAAKTSETNAKASETAAANSATAAASSQTAAKTSETNSAASKTAAANSATAAASSQSAAKTSETNAKSSETASATSAAAAASAATRAEDAAATNVNSVQRTALDGAAILPEGVNNRRPGVDATTGGMPASGLVVRGNTQTAGDYVVEFWNRAVGAWHAFASREWVNALVNAAVGSVYIYPNGGSQAAPANVALYSRYVNGNPFPGKAVHCRVQLRVNGVWGEAGGYIYGNGGGVDAGYGILSRQYGDEIITQTGNAALMTASHLDGNPFGLTTNIGSLPCRILVTQARG